MARSTLDARVTTAGPPTPRELWAQAGGDPARYRELMHRNGYEPEPGALNRWLVLDELNERLADALPDGTRLDWG